MLYQRTAVNYALEGKGRNQTELVRSSTRRNLPSPRSSSETRFAPRAYDAMKGGRAGARAGAVQPAQSLSSELIWSSEHIGSVLLDDDWKI